MDRASDSGSEGWGFESLPVYQKDQIPFGIWSFCIHMAKGLEPFNANVRWTFACRRARRRQLLTFYPPGRMAPLPFRCTPNKELRLECVLPVTVRRNRTAICSQGGRMQTSPFRLAARWAVGHRRAQRRFFLTICLRQADTESLPDPLPRSFPYNLRTVKAICHMTDGFFHSRKRSSARVPSAQTRTLGKISFSSSA